MNDKLQKIYVDSSYDWNKTVNGKGTGLICIAYQGKYGLWEYETHEVTLHIPGLRQLNNRFELRAIEMGIKIARRTNKKAPNHYVIYSDSRVAVGWANNHRVLWIPREENIAGIYIENNKLYQHQLC